MCILRSNAELGFHSGLVSLLLFVVNRFKSEIHLSIASGVIRGRVTGSRKFFCVF